MMKGDNDGALESLNNIMIAKKDAQPNFDAFTRYKGVQRLWERLCAIISEQRYEMRKIMEDHNITNHPIQRDEQSVRKLGTEEIIEVLLKAFDFELNSDGWGTLAKKFYVKTFYEDEMLFKCGDFNETMYIILKGEIQLFSGTRETGGEIEIARLHKGGILGESCMAHQSFTLNCRALQFTELLGIDKRDITKLIDKNPELGVKFFQQILTKVVEKMRESNLYNIRTGGGAIQSTIIDETDF